MKDRIQPWVAFLLCVAICALTLISSFVLSANRGWSLPQSLILLVCMLPMCFYHVGEQMVRLQREVQELRQRITEFEGPSNG